MDWYSDIRGKVRRGVALKSCTTFGIGGRADFFIEPADTADLKLLLNLAKRAKIPFFIIGAGSNLLVSDKGVRGIVLRLGAPFFTRVSLRGNIIHAGSGVLLSRLLRFCSEKGLCGLEFLSGIPGTLGGALMMNAGIFEKGKGEERVARNISDAVLSLEVMDYRGRIKSIKKKDIRFGYRDSSLRGVIVLGARLRLIKDKKTEVKKRVKVYLQRRWQGQDLSARSAGCFFRNPPHDSAGRLIDLCGLKGRRIGGAAVSSGHANFILNTGKASAKDVLRLACLIQGRVKRNFNITLRPEVKIW